MNETENNKDSNDSGGSKQPNILFITVDQMRYPDYSDPDCGFIPPLKEIFSFKPVSPNNPYAEEFPGFMRLRKNAVALHNHHIGTSACVPSRTLIYTGQYGTRTHVMETDSLFKFGSDPNFPWLHPRGIPTTGDWFRQAGYDTHYFGKWDMSYADVEGPMKGDINPWGFADWKLSSPDAQGGQLNQLGVYRDGGYADLACDFLRRKAMNYQDTPQEPKPWFATVSIVNPHDIASAYPISWWMPEQLESFIDSVNEERAAEGKAPLGAGYGVQTIQEGSEYDDPDTPKPVPAAGDLSNTLPGGSMRVNLNPNGFGTKETLFNNPQSLHDDLCEKPDCQFDYSYKMGMALKSRRPEPMQKWQTLPFQTYADNGDRERSDEWFQAYGQFYAYLHTLADREIDRVLKTLDECGLTDDTVVVFLSDHGEYGGVQGGMIEKWHTAYDQILRVPVIFSNPGLNDNEDVPREVEQLTSHIDVLPTLMGFAGYQTAEELDKLGREFNQQGTQTYVPLPGVNLVSTLQNPHEPIVYADSDQPRNEILFTTDDTITNHLKGEAATRAYEQFLQSVNEYIPTQPRLREGSVVQPNHIRCIKWTITDQQHGPEGSTWKLARYWDPEGKESDQWEFYYMNEDPAERNNLVIWEDGQPVLVPERIDTVDWGLTVEQVRAILVVSMQRLADLEDRYLAPVSPLEEAFVLKDS